MNELDELEDTITMLSLLAATFRGLEIAACSGESVIPREAWSQPCGLLEDLVEQAREQFNAAFEVLSKTGGKCHE